MSRNRILITAVAAALLVVCGIGIFFASNRDHAAERADEWTMQGMTLALDGSATTCTVRIAGTSRSYLLGGRVGAFETGTDGGIYVDGTRVCSCLLYTSFSFRLAEPSLSELGQITESYLCTRLERGFSTLDFYKSLFL